MDKGLTKRALDLVGCTVCWLGAAFFAFWEAVYAPWFFVLLGDVMTYGYDEAEGYDLHLAEDFGEARAFMLLIGIPFLLMLALAIHFTIKLRKRGKQNEHSIPDKW